MQTATKVGPMAVVNAYNVQYQRRYPDRYSSKRQPTIKNRSHVETAVAFLEWCEENDIEQPLIFIDIYFAYLANLRNVAPKFDSLRADALVDYYHEMIPSILENIRLKSTPENDPDRRYYRSLALNTRAHEAVRRDYVLTGREELCEIEMGVSGGYHPKSAFCTRCSRAATCAQKLSSREGFDVVQLRLGNHDALPAHVRKHVV